MLCPKCGEQGIESGDAFCRHCGFVISTRTSVPATANVVKTSAAATDSDASKGLEVFGVAIFAVAWLIATVIAFSMGLPSFSGTVLPWLSGAVMLVGFVMLFIGFELRHSH
jgi:ribosomal protein L37E